MLYANNHPQHYALTCICVSTQCCYWQWPATARLTHRKPELRYAHLSLRIRMISTTWNIGQAYNVLCNSFTVNPLSRWNRRNLYFDFYIKKVLFLHVPAMITFADCHFQQNVAHSELFLTSYTSLSIKAWVCVWVCVSVCECACVCECVCECEKDCESEYESVLMCVSVRKTARVSTRVCYCVWGCVYVSVCVCGCVSVSACVRECVREC